MPLIIKNFALLTVNGLLAGNIDCCCGQPQNCICVVPTQWRIVDGSGNLYAQGNITVDLPPLCQPFFEDFPNPFEPLFYWATGEVVFYLEVLGCNGESWDTIYSWNATISLCDGGRYPSEPLDGGWENPGDCACKNLQNVAAGIEECDPCPVFVPGLIGNGQDWRNPQPGTGTRFIGTIDGEWTNLNNWEDANGLTPAGSLPNAGTNVSVEADVTSTALPINVGELTIQADMEFNVVASVSDLYCYGIIERNALCEGVFGSLTVSGQAFVYGGGRNNGVITNTMVKFNGDGKNDTQGIVSGNARFDDTSRNDGTITGDAEFFDSTQNRGTVNGDGTFVDSSSNGQPGGASEATVEGNATFQGESQNWGQVDGDATFSGDALNIVGTVGGNAIFNDASQNIEGIVEGNAIFNSISRNDGAVDGDADFYGSSWNGYDQGYVPPPGHSPVGGTATFYDTSRNIVIINTAVFNDSSINTYRQTETTIEAGGVTNATFNDNSENMRGAYTTNATFNGNSKNDGNVTQNATFNGSSQNTADDPDNYMAVMGDATFNNDSVNRGHVDGTATFTGCSWNDGGTAGTFVPDPPPSAYPC